MSYEIIKGIKIKTDLGEVWIKSDSNNVTPKIFKWWKSNMLSEILTEKGLEETQKQILLEFYYGNFKKSNTLYEKSLFLLDFQKYDFSLYSSDEKLEELKNVLFANFNTFKNRKIGNFVIRNMENGSYISKITKCYITSCYSKSSAKVFKSEEEAKMAINDTTRFEVLKV